MERWRRPPVILGIEEDPSFVTDEEDGRVFGGVRITTDAETTERIRLGYICARCFQLHEEAYPEECSMCRFPMRRSQGEWFRRFYKGIEVVGSRVSLGDELERLKEERL